MSQSMRTCAGCTAHIEPGYRERKKRKWCSESCRSATVRRSNPEYAARARVAAAARYRAKKRVRRTYDLSCARCCAEFVATHGNRKYCSRSCGLAAYNARRRSDGRSADLSAKRRAMEKGAKVSPGKRIEVAERDGWRCVLCLGDVDRTVLYPAPDAAVIDHVVPLSAGGEHAPSNWALTHSFCNSLKSDLSVSAFRQRYPDIAERFVSRMHTQLEAA